MILFAFAAWSQESAFGPNVAQGPANGAQAVVLPPQPPPRMAPELALKTFEQRTSRQAAELGTYSAMTTITADLLDTKQKGEYELRRLYVAPKTLVFRPQKFTGDGFVKNNVIVRFLQAETEHVQAQRNNEIALDETNYKFSFKGTEWVDGRPVHIYQVKPRKKRVGLFKGKMALDALTGSLRRVEGVLVKSPSFFLKKVEFVQEFADFGNYTLPVHMRSEAKARIIGKTVFEVLNTDYHFKSFSEMQSETAQAVTTGTQP